MNSIVAGLALMAAVLVPQDAGARKKELQERVAQIERKLLDADDAAALKGILAERDRLLEELKRGTIHLPPMVPPPPAPPVPPVGPIGPLRSYDYDGWVLQQDAYGARRVQLTNRMQDLTKMVEALRTAGGAQEKLDDALKTLEECRRQMETLDTQHRLVITRGIGEDRSWTLHVDGEADDLDRQSRQLGDELRRTPSSEGAARDELRKKLDGVLEELFERREKGRWKELEDLETRMKEMRKTLETRKQNKAAIIEKRAKELAGEKSDMDW